MSVHWTVVYVNDLIFWSRVVPQINQVAMELLKLGVDLEQEDNAAGFLGVTLDRDASTGLLEMKQTGLIKRVVEALGLDDGYTKGKHTPAESKPLVKDADGEGAHGGFSYSSVFGMLLYLSGHTRPDIAYAVNCCARYMFCPKYSHELALKRIGRYLKQTSDHGMVMNLSSDICKIDVYLWAREARGSIMCEKLHKICHYIQQCSYSLEITAANGNSSFNYKGRNHCIIGVL
jgi:hypothetical protein